MIQIGDLIQWSSKRWLVYKIDPTTATAFIVSEEHEVKSIGTEENCVFICNPIQDWPSIAVRSQNSFLVVVCKATLKGAVPLVWLFDWVKLVNLYLNPSLGLGYKDRILVNTGVKTGVVVSSINIPRGFLPAKLKRDKKIMKKNRNLYDHLTEEKDDE